VDGLGRPLALIGQSFQNILAPGRQNEPTAITQKRRVDTCRVGPHGDRPGETRRCPVARETGVFVTTDLVVAVSTTTSVSNDVDATAIGWLWRTRCTHPLAFWTLCPIEV